MGISNLIFYSLAAWRLTYLIVNETGPFGIFSKLREIAGLKYDRVGHMISAKNRFWEGLGCMYCVSVWVGFLMLGIYLLWGHAGVTIFSLPLFLSMGVILWERFLA